MGSGARVYLWPDMSSPPRASVAVLCALFLGACGGGVAASGRHPGLAQLWRECQREADAGAAPDPHVYTCTYQGARYEIPEQGTRDVIDVDVDRIPYNDPAYNRTSPYVVVRGLDPDDRVTLGGLGPERAAVGDTALMLFGLATRGNAGAAPQQSGGGSSDGSPAPPAAPGAPAPYAARTEHLTMAPGLTGLLLIRHDHREHVVRIVSESEIDFLLGVSVSMDLNLLDDRPFGAITLGDPVTPGTAEPRTLRFSQDPIYAVTAHALIGLRLSDTALWLGVPVLSTTGSPLSGIELHVGQRFRSFSQAMYFGLYGALRWASRPRTVGYTSDDVVEHIPRDFFYSFTFGIELQFDLLTLAGGRDGVVSTN